LGEFAAESGFLDDEATGKFGTGESERGLVAILVIFRTADDLAGAGAVVHLADAEAVGVGVGCGGEDVGDDDMGAFDAG